MAATASNSPSSIVSGNRPINPHHVAWKLRAVRNFELPETQKQLAANPRLQELLWFLTWASEAKNYAGGLAKFAADFIEANWEKIGPRAVVCAGIPEKYTLQQAGVIWESIKGGFSFEGYSGLLSEARKNAR